MTTEVWLRNPTHWILEAVECGVGDIVFDKGALIKRNADGPRMMSLHYPATTPWRLLVVDNFHVDEYRPGFDKAVAQYPVWNSDRESWEELLTLIYEQEQNELPDKRVFICSLPDARSPITRRLLSDVGDLQRDHPSVVLHVHGLMAFHQAFVHGFGAVDLELRTAAAHKRLHMPMGKMVHIDWASEHIQWVNMLGFSLPDLQVPRNRCMFNIKSALWAGENYTKNERFLSRAPRAKHGTGMHQLPKPKPKHPTPYRGSAENGDKFICNLCSLQNNCQFFRAEAVCGVPGSEPTELAKFFNSRDSDTIITGLQTLLQFQARRVESLAAEEQQTKAYDKELTKLVDSLFDRGIKLAKLVDPKLSNPKVAILMAGGGGGAPMPGVINHDPREMVRNVIIELEGRGISRDNITPDMLANILGAPDPQQAIQATAIANKP